MTDSHLEALLMPEVVQLSEWCRTAVVQCDCCARISEVLLFPSRQRPQRCKCFNVLAETVLVLDESPSRIGL